MKDYELDSLLDDDILHGSSNEDIDPKHEKGTSLIKLNSKDFLLGLLGGLVLYMYIPKRVETGGSGNILNRERHNEVLWNYALENGYSLIINDPNKNRRTVFPIGVRRGYNDDFGLKVVYFHNSQIRDINELREEFVVELGPEATPEQIRFVEQNLNARPYNI